MINYWSLILSETMIQIYNPKPLVVLLKKDINT